jgi:hypothetical protein
MPDVQPGRDIHPQFPAARCLQMIKGLITNYGEQAFYLAFLGGRYWV